MGIVYKPQTDKGPVILLDNDISTPPTITLPDGTVVQARKAGQGAPGAYHTNEKGSGYQWVFPSSVLNQKDAFLNVGGQTQKLSNTNMSYRGGAIGGLSESSKGAVGSGGSSIGTGVAGGKFDATTVGSGMGVAPAYIGDLFPKAATTDYTPIEGAAKSYQYIDPIKFGKDFNPFQRKEIGTNFSQGGDQALQAIGTELQGLKNFVPAVQALKNSTISADNLFNQNERTTQVNAAVPDVVKDLNTQAQDARTYASGEVPNSVVDAALSLTDRSAAADQANSSGFGVRSSTARKLSDLMSAKDRIGLSQYGEGLLSSNAAARQNLLLAPTEYNNTGSQISGVPSISGSQLQVGQANEINGQTLVNSASAFQSATQQSQFISGLNQQTQQFNASNTLSNDQFNANNINNFALSYFNYLNSYVNSVAGAGQTDINTGVAIDEQNKARDEANKQKDKTQHANTVTSILETGGKIIGAAIGA